MLVRPCISGIPKYEPRSKVGRIPNSGHITFRRNNGVLDENQIWDLGWFILWPDTSTKNSQYMLHCPDFKKMRSQPHNNKSSEKNKWEILRPQQVIETGFYTRDCTIADIDCPKTSIHKTKRYGDSGSPCLKPRDGVKCCNNFPFQHTTSEEVVIVFIIKPLSFSLKPNP